MTQRIVQLARALGQTTASEEELLVCLCDCARRELVGSLREGVSERDCPEAFALAGAWLALAGLEVSRQAGQPAAFRAGEVSVEAGTGEEKARLLRTQAKQLMAPWAKDERFAFYGV